MNTFITKFSVGNYRNWLITAFLTFGIFLPNPSNAIAQKPDKTPTNQIADKQTAPPNKAEEQAKTAAKQAHEFAHGVNPMVNWADADTRREIIRRFETAANLWRTANKPLEEFDALDEVGASYAYLKDFPAALKTLNRQLTLARRVPNAFLEYNSLVHIADVHLALNEPRESLDFFKQAQAVLETESLRGDLNGVFRKTNLSETELERYKNWRITPTENLFHRLEDVLFNRLGALYKKLDEPEKAVEFYLKSLTAARLARSFGYGEIADRVRQVALTLTDARQFDRAAEFLKTEIAKARDEGNNGLEAELVELAAKINKREKPE